MQPKMLKSSIFLCSNSLSSSTKPTNRYAPSFLNCLRKVFPPRPAPTSKVGSKTPSPFGMFSLRSIVKRHEARDTNVKPMANTANKKTNRIEKLL